MLLDAGPDVLVRTPPELLLASRLSEVALPAVSNKSPSFFLLILRPASSCFLLTRSGSPDAVAIPLRIDAAAFAKFQALIASAKHTGTLPVL